MKALPKYRSHKVVSAAEITFVDNEEHIVGVKFPDGTEETVSVTAKFWERYEGTENGSRGYVVIYDDGYISWSPKKAFEEGYSLLDENSESN